MVLAFFFAGFWSVFAQGARQMPLIPLPISVENLSGEFRLQATTAIWIESGVDTPLFAATHLAERLRKATGHPFPILFKKSPASARDVILFRKSKSSLPSDEAYTLEATGNSIVIEASTFKGHLYGVHTILQMAPPGVYGTRRVTGELKIPAVRITDAPRFSWRGMHLDCSRHFFPKEFVKTYIDMLVMHKMNVFHWHFSDDQGWRLEIKKYPKLTSVSAWRADRGSEYWYIREPQREGEEATYGGFYTQDDVREIVEYAAERGITVVPEVEMPAHTTAVLAAYPQYSCTGGPFTVPTGSIWPITDIFCAGNDSTFHFLEDVLTEVMELFPSTYIHIGGDEADKKEWKTCPKCQERIRTEDLKNEEELQSYFIKRIERFLVSKGRRLIGWDEILEGGLAPEATVMSWRGTRGGIEAAREGHHVVMTPTSHCYFDYYQGPQEHEPLGIGGYLPISTVYSFEPVPQELTGTERDMILGGQGNLWAEFVPTPQAAQYMTLPRMAAMSEVLWSPAERKDSLRFFSALMTHLERYAALGYNYARSMFTVNIGLSVDTISKEGTVIMFAESPFCEIRYTLDGTEPTGSSPLYGMPVPIKKTTEVKAAAFLKGERMGTVSARTVHLHKALYRKIILGNRYERYTAGGPYGLVNGIKGSLSYEHWQGYRGTDLLAVLDLEEITSISTIGTSYLKNTSNWIFPPLEVQYSISEDGTNYEVVGTFSTETLAAHETASVVTFGTKLQNERKARFIKITAKALPELPNWHGARGGKPWLFVDEIVVY